MTLFLNTFYFLTFLGALVDSRAIDSQPDVQTTDVPEAVNTIHISETLNTAEGPKTQNTTDISEGLFGLPGSSVYKEPIDISPVTEASDVLERKIVGVPIWANLETGVLLKGIPAKWPMNIIPYTISTDFGANETELIENSMKGLEDGTCIKFIQRTTEPDYVSIERLPGSTLCVSHIGKQGGPQVLILSSNCMNTGTIQHELMHSIGFHHEQSRWDRDDYVEILWGNILIENLHDFVRRSTESLDIPYDFNSIMQYESGLFSKNRFFTIVRRGDRSLITRTDVLSYWDKEKIRRLYGCSEWTGRTEVTETSTVTSTTTMGYSETNTSVASKASTHVLNLRMDPEEKYIWRRPVPIRLQCATECQKDRRCYIAQYQNSTQLCSAYGSDMDGKITVDTDYSLFGIWSTSVTSYRGVRWEGVEIEFEEKPIADWIRVTWTESSCVDLCQIHLECNSALYDTRQSKCHLFSKVTNYTVDADFVSTIFSSTADHIEKIEQPELEIPTFLGIGGKLLRGKKMISANGEFEMVLESDGNMVLRRIWNQELLWVSHTSNFPIEYLYFGRGGLVGLYGEGEFHWKLTHSTDDDKAIMFAVSSNGTLGTFSKTSAISWEGKVIDGSVDQQLELSANLLSEIQIWSPKSEHSFTTNSSNAAECLAQCQSPCVTTSYNSFAKICQGFNSSSGILLESDNNGTVGVSWKSNVTRKAGQLYGNAEDELEFGSQPLIGFSNEPKRTVWNERRCLLACHAHSECRVAVFNNAEKNYMLKRGGTLIASDGKYTSFVFTR